MRQDAQIIIHFPNLTGINNIYPVDGIATEVVWYGLWVAGTGCGKIFYSNSTFFENLMKNQGIENGGLLNDIWTPPNQLGWRI